MYEIKRGTLLSTGAGIVRILPRGSRYTAMKRAIDVLLVLVSLPIWAVVFSLVAILIKLFSPGPILYRQERIGLNGDSFVMFKFRTMTQGNTNSAHREYVQRLIRENLRPEDLGVQSLKIATDTRITRIGKLLRATSLDELPQLLNVLRGEMSLVGPRPPLPYEYEVYSSEHKRRMNIRPGITGLWQVTAHNRVSFEEMVEIDLAYATAMNPLLDLLIIALTPWAMLNGE